MNAHIGVMGLLIEIRHTCYLLLKFVSPDFGRKSVKDMGLISPPKWANLKSNFLKFHHRNQVILGIEKARKWRISGLF